MENTLLGGPPLKPRFDNALKSAIGDKGAKSVLYKERPLFMLYGNALSKALSNLPERCSKVGIEANKPDREFIEYREVLSQYAAE